MKKSLLVLAMGTLFATTASANFYVQGDIGVSKTKFSAYPVLGDTKFEPRISVGYDFGAFRLAADYTHYGKFSGKHYNESITAKVYGLGFSAFYDFNVNSTIKPYIGARLASNVFDIQNTGPSYFRDAKTSKLGYGAIVGAQYNLANNLSLNGGIEYNSLGHFPDTNINQYGAKVGLRYDF
ncbi:opacity family porin [Pasteurella oralis]|uniref:Opacity family porin n=1 Tax=Pasteurella oralis TaxID=1071947 RepID=A0ABW4NWB7_9PAST